jgi:hypothetical protein
MGGSNMLHSQAVIDSLIYLPYVAIFAIFWWHIYIVIPSLAFQGRDHSLWTLYPT